MTLKLRDLIRSVRACRTAAEERAVIAKECADIRTSFRSKDDEHLRHRNVAKLLYIYMLGYPTHFGQMEAMKLLATQRFAEKRIGYLALMLLLDENQELLMLATNSMKRDLESTNPYIQGLSLCAIGNIASQAIARDLSLDIIKVMTSSSNNPYIRKKAALCALRTLRRVEELVDDYINPAGDLLNDRNNSVQMAAIHLMSEVVKINPEVAIPQYRLLIPRLCAIIRSTWNVNYNPEYDIMGINDPFLQVNVLRFIRLLSQPTITIQRSGDSGIYKEPELINLGPIEDDHLERINDTLTALGANIDASKVPGAAIHYEAILTTLTISNDQTLRVNAIIQLGKFLQSRDNNIRYISLNTMYQVAQQQLSAASTSLKGVKGVQLRELKIQQHNALTNLEVIQRYRNTIVAYLKDPDPSIRKRALSLIYALVTEKNVRPLVRELLLYLTIKSGGADDINAVSTQDTTFTNVPALVNNNLPYAGGPSLQSNAVKEYNGASTSSNAEFKSDLTHKIYYIIYQYAPNILWQLHSMIMLMSTDNEYINENTFFEFVSLIQNYHKTPLYLQHINTPTLSVKTSATSTPTQITKPHIDAFIMHELYLAVNNADRIKYPFLIQAFFFFVSQHSQFLSSTQGAQMATIVSHFLSQDSSTHLPQQQGGQIPQPPVFEPHSYDKINYDVITNVVNSIMQHSYTTEQSKQVGLTAIIRLSTTIKKATANINPLPTEIQSSLDTLEYILSMHRHHVNVDLQQRATEYLIISRSKNDKLNPVAFSTKIVFPVVNFTRTNLDFDSTQDDDIASPQSTQHADDLISGSNNNNNTQEVDVFASLGQDSIVAGTVEPTQTTQPPQSNNGFDVLNDLLAPTPQPIITEKKPAFIDPLGGSDDIFSQMTSPTNATTTTSSNNNNSTAGLDFAFGAIAVETDSALNTSITNEMLSPSHQQQQQSTVSNDPFGDLLSGSTPQNTTTNLATSPTNNNNNSGGIDLLSSYQSNTSITTPPSPPPQQQQQSSPTSINVTDPFSMFSSTPTANTTPQTNNTSTSNNNSNDLLDSFAGLGSIQKSPSPPPQSSPLDDFDDEFESAIPEEPVQPIEKSITVYNANDVTIKMVYTPILNEPAVNNITYKINAVMTATGSVNIQQMDLRLAARAPLTKTIKVPTSRILNSNASIQQDITITNPTTNMEGQTTFKCMFKCVLNGTPFDSPAFSVSL